MRIEYDREGDALYIQVSKTKPHHVIDLPGATGFSVDVDQAGNLVGIEILQASKALGNELSTLTVEDVLATAQS
jgi:uncharacterized protein YuzE